MQGCPLLTWAGSPVQTVGAPSCEKAMLAELRIMDVLLTEASNGTCPLHDPQSMCTCYQILLPCCGYVNLCLQPDLHSLAHQPSCQNCCPQASPPLLGP
jgi:hypothetical protein